MPTLVVLQGPDKGRTYEVPAEPAALGREADLLELSDHTVSRHHARIVPENGRYLLEDLNSANGTYVNGVRISKPVELHQGDQIRMGMSLLVFGGLGGRSGLPTPKPVDLVDLDAHDGVDSSVLKALPANEDSVMIAAPEAAAAAKNLRILYQLSGALNSMYSVPQLLEYVMNMIFEKVGAERGFILMRAEDGDELEPLVVRHRDPKAGAEKIRTSRTIVQYVLDRQEAILCTNALGDRRFSAGQSVHQLGIRSVICAPIVARSHILGVIHVDTSVADYTFTEEQLHLLTAIGYATGLAVENAHLIQAQVQAERLAATGETVASLSHYIKNILQGLRGGAEVIQMGLNNERIPQIAKGWRVVQRNLRRIYDLTLNMLAFSKDREPNYRAVDVNRTIGEVVELVRPQCTEKDVMVITELQEDLAPMMLDEDGIHQVILNMVVNAIDAVAPHRGVITIRSHFDGNSGVGTITIADNGPGIDEEVRDDLFVAFKSTKGQGGTGLGLAVAQKIVEEHHGRIVVQSEPGKGTTFVIELPSGGGGVQRSAQTLHH